jgi:hypothetical protein
LGFVVIPATRRRLNSSAAAAVLFKRLACWGDATWLASNRERLFISLLLPSLRGLLPDAPSACPSECGAPPSSSATPSSDSGSLHLIQAQSFSRFLCRPSQLLGPPMCHTWVSRFSMKRETDAFASGEGGNSVKQSPIMVKLTRDMQIAMASRQNLGQVAAFMAGFVACMLISRTQSGGFEGTFRCWTLRHL